MNKKVLIVLINTNSLDSCLASLDEIRSNYSDECRVLLVDNGWSEENSFKAHHKDYSFIDEYVPLTETYEDAVILYKIYRMIEKYDSKVLYIVSSDHHKTISYLKVLLSMSELSNKSVLGIKGGSVFSAFFHNFPIFQQNTNTEWLDFNGMLAPFEIWKELGNLDLRYYSGYHQVDFGRTLTNKDYKLFKLKPYIFIKTKGLRNYFRMRNPFMFMQKYFGWKKYLWSILYLLIQFPFAIYFYKRDKNYLSGLLDGMKLLFSTNPSSTS